MQQLAGARWQDVVALQRAAGGDDVEAVTDVDLHLHRTKICKQESRASGSLL